MHHLSRLAETFEDFRDRRGAPARYGSAACLAAALLLSFTLYPNAAEEHPFSAFYAVVTVSALLGGLVETLPSAGAPGRVFPQERLHTGLLLLEGVGICLLVRPSSPRSGERRRPRR